MINICDENKIIQIDKINKIDNTETTDEEYNLLCLICMDMKGEIILCSKCKYVYCPTCAEKINKLCSICFRNKNKINSNQNQNEYNNYYDNYDYYGELVFEPSISQYYSVMISYTISSIIRLCWIILFVVFGYIGVIFLLRIIFNLTHFYNIL